MRGRRGFALLAVLWVIAALAMLVGLGLGATRVGGLASANRLVLGRAQWAADACLAVAEARWVAHRLADSATIDLGRTTRCRWQVDDPTARINVNTTAPEILSNLAQAVGVPDALAETLVVHRPYQDTADVRDVLRADSALLPFLTVDGPGTIDANASPAAVLRSLPGFTAEVVGRLSEYRRLGRPIASLDQLASVTTGDRAALLAHYADLSGLLSFAPPQLMLTAQGWVGDDGNRALRETVEELVVPLSGRLAVIRRRQW